MSAATRSSRMRTVAASGVRRKLSRALHAWKAKHRAKARRRVECLAAMIPRGAVVFDVGAHFGYFAKEFCRIHEGSCAVYCFEPLSYNCSILHEVLQGFANAHPERVALCDVPGEMDLYVPIKANGKLGLGLAHLGAESARECLVERVATDTLDARMRALALRRLDFIKCDIEGAELLMLRGAAESLARHRPALLCEVDHRYTERLGYPAEAVFEYLHGLGYRGHRIDFQTGAIRSVGGYEIGGDYLFSARACEGGG